MGRRIGIGILAAVIVIVVAALVAPYFVGLSAESNFKAQVAYLNSLYADRDFELRVDSYDRGFYRSEAVVTLSGTPNTLPVMAELWTVLLGHGGETAQFHLRINHGPIPFAAFADGHVNFTPVLYTAEFQTRKLPALSLIGILKPESYTVQYFTGTTQTTLTIPPGRFGVGPKFQTRWEGGHASGTLNGAHDRVSYAGELGGIHVAGQDSDGDPYQFDHEGLSFSGNKHRGVHGFWIGRDRLVVEGLKGTGDDTQIAVSRLTYQGTTQASGDGRWIGGSVHFEQTGGNVRGWRWTDIKFNGALAKLDAQGLRAFVRDIQGARAGSAAMMEPGSAALLLAAALPKAVTPETRGQLEFAIAAPEGNAHISGRLSFTAPVSATAAAPPPAVMMQRADLTFDIAFDRQLLQGFTRHFFGAPAAQSSTQDLAAWTAAGYLRQTGGSYHTKLRYRDGVLTANGRVIEETNKTVPSASGPADEG